MKVYPTNQIRNLAVVGHGDAGKAQLVSSLLYVAGTTPRWGKVDEGTSTTDYDEDSIARKINLNSARNTFSRAIVPFTLHIGREANFKGVVDVVHMKAYEFDANGKAKEIPIPEAGREVVDAERTRLVEVIA